MSIPVRIILVGTTHPGNIGATARAMCTMGLDRLTLVAPREFPSPEATARAAGADAVLEQARVCATLEEALAGCRFVVGASARLRAVPWPAVTPREAAPRLLAESAHGETAVMFGRESSGLNNEELARCHALLHIPTNPEYSSLNLAMAVQVVAYELRLAALGEAPPEQERVDPLAPAEELERFYEHLERTLVDAGFLNPANPRHLMLRLRRLFNRAMPEEKEVRILRGILSALEPRRMPASGSEAQEALRYTSPDAGPDTP
ncbi:RNA methyltransferase [Thioalkalivibrio sp. XN279]|uniref:RNA methyltransferase n=1 Tax=Thioalkalivibrio sp. XN279 TaxID=2714953 RepID=UPI00140A46F9|nr:RNA methyltransferase [Thioalkalivibrio sp. XN279]NHA15633.1 RNA methyltransferase [Thioalkalivibrio sp. XN279]